MAHERERHQTQSNFIARQTHRASEPALQILSYITQTEYLLVESVYRSERDIGSEEYTIFFEYNVLRRRFFIRLSVYYEDLFCIRFYELITISNHNIAGDNCSDMNLAYCNLLLLSSSKSCVRRYLTSFPSHNPSTFRPKKAD